MLSLVSSESGIPIRKAQLDADPYLLNAPNGIVDLRTGQLAEHRRSALLTRSTSVPYDPSATCPTWARFLDDVMCHRQDLVRWLQLAVGYSLVGTTREQVFIILYGTGQNGKSTFIKTVRHIIGSYGAAVSPKTFVSDASAGIPNDIAALDGIRFVIASEAKESAPLDEALVKSVTGGEPISARFMRAEWFEFLPQFQVWYSSNHKPTIRGTDHGIWRRIRLVPWEWTVPPGADDKHLDEKLLAEADGILAWAVRGAVEWARAGLGLPDGVADATREYRSEMDLLSDFLGDCCIVGPEAVGCVNSDLFRAFTRWLEENGEKAKSHRWLSRQLRDRGFKQARAEARSWDGIALNGSGRGYLQVGSGNHQGYSGRLAWEN
jgi:putative DNA primase/helicase